MRQPIFDSPIQFYATAGQVAALKRKAQREGRTYSEIIRTALRRELEAA